VVKTSFRHLYFSNNAYIRIKNKQLEIEQDEVYSIPLTDISTIMFENLKSNISIAALSHLAEYGVTVFVCDDKHLPNGIILPLNAHHRQLKVLKQQLGMMKPFVKRTWQSIVKQKISNQSSCLGKLGKKEAMMLLDMVKKVESGDSSYMESAAASIYFKSLFGNDFTRSDDNNINALLNYSYSLVRGAISRVLVSYGFVTCLGLFHKNELNQFNLSDDFIEPYRGIIDYYVLENIPMSEPNFSPVEKKVLYNIFNYAVQMPDGVYTITSSIDSVISSFVTCLRTNDYTLLQLPSLM
jgi:CRISPR-associated protein Cas1